MKQIFCLLIIFCSFGLPLQAKKLPGRIFFPDRTEAVLLHVPIHAFSKEPMYYALQTRVQYTCSEGKLRTLWPSDARGFHFDYEGETHRLVSALQPRVLGKEHVFLRVLEEGKVTLLEYYEGNDAYDGQYAQRSSLYRHHALMRGNERPVHWSALTFKKESRAFFAECPALWQHVEQEKWGRRDLPEMVRFYNERCP